MSKIAARIARVNAIATARTIIVKVGSAVLTTSEGLDLPVLCSIASQIASIRKLAVEREGRQMPRRIVLVSSGAVAAGTAVLEKSGNRLFLLHPKAKHAIAAVGQGLLMQAWNDAFAPYDLLTGQVLLTREDLGARHRFKFASETFSQMLRWNVVPIVNENDTVSILGLKFGDNDYLASLLVNLVGASLFVNLTSASGVMDSNPDRNPDARPMSYIENIRSLDLGELCGAGTSCGSGGMHSKLLAARRVAQLGVPTLVLPGREPEILLQAFETACAMAAKGEQEIAEAEKVDLGTWICPSEKGIPRRKFWLAYQSAPAGIVEIDDGAARALRQEGGSLLPGGIKRVEGDFANGALLLVRHDGKNLGVGFSNYSSADLARIAGLKRHEVAAILGLARYPDVIHRDNMLLDAAIGDPDSIKWN